MIANHTLKLIRWRDKAMLPKALDLVGSKRVNESRWQYVYSVRLAKRVGKNRAERRRGRKKSSAPGCPAATLPEAARGV